MRARLNNVLTCLKGVDASFERTRLHKFLDGTPRLIFYAFFGGTLPVSFAYHAYGFTGFSLCYWLLAWPKSMLDLILPGGFRVGGEVVTNQDAAIAISYLVYSCALLFLLLREERSSSDRS